MKKVLQLQGLDCANCAAELESEIAKIAGVSFASLSFVNQKLTVEYDNEETLRKIIDSANHFEEVRVVEKPVKKEKPVKEWLLIAASALLFVGGFLFEWFSLRILSYICFAAAYFAVGTPVLLATSKNIAKGKFFDENFLMTLASIGAVCIGEIGEGVAVMLLYQIGETLQGMAVASSRQSVTALMELKSEEATLLCGGEQTQVSPEELKIGDRVLVKAGEKVPVDGALLGEVALLDTKSLTGEAKLKVVQTGGEMLSGCINAGNAFEMKVLRPYTDSAVCKILDLVENAASGKAAPEKFITKFARIYTPVVCALALALAIFAPLVSGLAIDGRLYFKDGLRWVQSALTFLVISCPCALIISVPLTYFSGIGACARRGILVKGATYLDEIAAAKIVAFDKTGTLTEGNFRVRNVATENGGEENEVLALAAVLERSSSHPIAKAFSEVESKYTAENVEEKAGRGLKGEIAGTEVLVGNAEWLKENGVAVQKSDSPYTLVYVAKGGVLLGVIEIGDRLRKEAKTAVEELKKLGLTRSVMLTGDNLSRAQKIANEVGVYEVNAELLPDGKLQRAQELKREGGLIYLGDGVNDAPVMTVADCAVSMGKLGSAAAVEASDFVLITDDLTALPKGIKIARKTRKIVRQNIIFSITMKAAFMALGAAGILQLWLAVFADVGVMLLAVLNSLRVRGKGGNK